MRTIGPNYIDSCWLQDMHFHPMDTANSNVAHVMIQALDENSLTSILQNIPLRRCLLLLGDLL